MRRSLMTCMLVLNDGLLPLLDVLSSGTCERMLLRLLGVLAALLLLSSTSSPSMLLLGRMEYSVCEFLRECWREIGREAWREAGREPPGLLLCLARGLVVVGVVTGCALSRRDLGMGVTGCMLPLRGSMSRLLCCERCVSRLIGELWVESPRCA